jgi:cytochrome c oxidase subunit 2
MHIDRFEAMFLWLAAGMLFLFAGAIVISVFGLGIQLPTISDQIAPDEIDTTAGFDRPGLREVYPARYEVFMVAQTWSFTPASIEVPVGSEVTFFVTSRDIIHGFKVFDTNINVMVVPGQVTEFTHTFNEAGDYQFYCHEYCGAGHHTMTGIIHVVEE